MLPKQLTFGTERAVVGAPVLRGHRAECAIEQHLPFGDRRQTIPLMTGERPRPAVLRCLMPQRDAACAMCRTADQPAAIERMRRGSIAITTQRSASCCQRAIACAAFSGE